MSVCVDFRDAVGRKPADTQATFLPGRAAWDERVTTDVVPNDPDDYEPDDIALQATTLLLCAAQPDHALEMGYQAWSILFLSRLQISRF